MKEGSDGKVRKSREGCCQGWAAKDNLDIITQKIHKEHTNLHNSLVQNSPKLETIQMFITQTDKYNYSITMQWSIMQHHKNWYKWYNQGAPWDSALKGGNWSWISKFMNLPVLYVQKRNLQKQDVDWCYAWVHSYCQGVKTVSSGMKNVQKLSSSNVYTSPQIYWIHCILSFTHMDYLVFNNASLE